MSGSTNVIKLHSVWIRSLAAHWHVMAIHRSFLKLALLLFALTNGFNADAEKSPPFAFVETKTIESFSVGVMDYEGKTNTTPEKLLCVGIWSTNGDERIAVPPHPESFYQVELFDANGVPVTKTESGKKVGVKFNEYVRSAFEKGVYRNEIAMKKGDVPRWMIMFSPAEYFKIEKPGKYTLQIWFQIIAFSKSGPNTHEYTKKLVRFPPLDYLLVEPSHDSKTR